MAYKTKKKNDFTFKSVIGAILVVILAIVLVIALGWAICYGFKTFMESTEPFQHAETAIRRSETIKQHVGEIESVKLPTFGHAEYKRSYNSAGSFGIASFLIEIKGSQGAVELFVILEIKSDKWHIEKASLKDKDVSDMLRSGILIPETLGGNVY